jgi:hypothetical protein
MTVLDLILLGKEFVENQEGEVITFEDSQMAKCKVNWYLSLHGLIGPDAFKENLLVKTILNGDIDDVIAALVPGEKKDKIIEMDKKVTDEFNAMVREMFSLEAEYFHFHNENRKEFALKWRTHRLFGSVIKNINEPLTESKAENLVKDYILRVTNSLGKAKEWVGSL